MSVESVTSTIDFDKSKRTADDWQFAKPIDANIKMFKASKNRNDGVETEPSAPPCPSATDVSKIVSQIVSSLPSIAINSDLSRTSLPACHITSQFSSSRSDESRVDI